jgi:hypothetical protein
MTIISDYGSEWTVLPPGETVEGEDAEHDGKTELVPGYRATMSAFYTRRHHAQSAG